MAKLINDQISSEIISFIQSDDNLKKAKIDQRSVNAIRMKYGIGCEPKSYSEIGKHMSNHSLKDNALEERRIGISKASVSYIVKKAVAKINEYMNRDKK